MEIKNVIGDNTPEMIEKLQGVILINVQNEISKARAFVRANR